MEESEIREWAPTDPETMRRRIDEPEQSEIERKSVEEALRDKEQRYRRIVDTAYEGIWVFDEEYKTVFANRRMADMLGYEPEGMTGKEYGHFLFPEDFPDLEKKMNRRRGGVAERYERKLRRRDGSTLWALVSATPIMDERGTFQGSFAMFTDITERREAEEALLRSEAKFRSIFENAVEGIFQSTPDGHLITVNPAMAAIFGYGSPEEMVGSVTSIGREIYANGDDRHTFKRFLEVDGVAEGFEAQFYRKDGSRLWGSLNVRAVKAETGAVLFYEGTLIDITSRKEAEDALLRSEAKYRNLFENAVEGIFQVTAEGRYLSINPALAQIHGYTSPEEMMRSVTDIAHQLYVDPSRRAELMRLIREEGSVKNFEIMMRRKDGSLLWGSINSHGVRDARGTITHYEGTLQDITSRKFAEEELKQRRRAFEGVIGAMSRSVEIRDPGTAGHQERVAKLAMAIARDMGFSEDLTEGIGLAATVHDLGKITVPGEILSKPARLNETEYAFIKVHPRAGYDLLKDAGLPYPVSEIVLQHHERLNGSGYPQGLKGSKILLEARVVAVADVVEAIVSPRPYRPARELETALKELQKGRGIIYDAKVVDACTSLFRQKGFRFE